jgi:hypothetical protein
MGVKLRTVLRSWRVWMAVVCVVYLGLGPLVMRALAAWPGAVNVAYGLAVLALLFMSWIVGDVFTRYVISPFLMVSLGDKKWTSRTPKAKEKAADSMMSVGTAVHSATFISLLVFPFTAFIQTMASGTDPVSALASWWQPDRWSWWHTIMLLGLFFIPLSVGRQAQRRALDIYDELSPSTPVVAPATEVTHEPPRSLDPGPPVYVRANEGSRRRRHHRTK